MGAPVTGTHKVVENAHKFYDALVERANIESWPTSDNGEVELLIFRGKLTSAWASLDVSQAYYSKVRRVLLDHGCIRVVERGTRGVDSVIQLLNPPPDAAQVPEEPLTARATYANLDRRVNALEAARDTLGGLNIAEALRNMELRINHLESKLGGKRENGEKNGTKA